MLAWCTQEVGMTVNVYLWPWQGIPFVFTLCHCQCSAIGSQLMSLRSAWGSYITNALCIDYKSPSRTLLLVHITLMRYSYNGQYDETSDCSISAALESCRCEKSTNVFIIQDCHTGDYIYRYWNCGCILKQERTKLLFSTKIFWRTPEVKKHTHIEGFLCILHTHIMI